MFAISGILREFEQMQKFNASSHVPIFHPGHFVIFVLPMAKPIHEQNYRERYRKGQAPYAHSNIEPESHHDSLTDEARSIGTIVQRTSCCPNVELHMVRDGHKISALVATWDIYAVDELLLRRSRCVTRCNACGQGKGLKQSV